MHRATQGKIGFDIPFQIAEYGADAVEFFNKIRMIADIV